MNLNPSSPKSRLTTHAVSGLILCAIFVAAASLRYFFASEPLWIDELHTAWAIDSDLHETADRAGQGNQTPLYFWLLWTGQSIFGFSHSLLRLPSVVCGLLAIGIACWLNWRFSRCWTAILVVASILAFDSFQLYYSSEARPYALMQLFATFQLGCVACFSCTPNNKNWLAYLLISFSTFALLLTHITGIWLVAAEFIFFASIWRRSPQSKLAVAVFSGVLATLLNYTLLFLAIEHRSDWWVVDNSSLYFWQMGIAVLAQWLVPVAGWLITAWSHNEKRSLESFTPISKPISTVAIQHRRIYMILVLCAAIVPIIVVASLHLLGIAPLASVRYAFVAMIPITLLCGMLIAHISDRWIRTAVAVIVLVSTSVFNPVVMNVVDTGKLANMRSENWSEAAKQLEDASLVFLLPNLVEDTRLKTSTGVKKKLNRFNNYLRFCLTSPATPELSAKVCPVPTLADERWTKMHLELIQKHQHGWIVMRASRELATEICHELTTFAAANDINLELEVIEQERNDVRLAKFETNVQ